MCSDEMVVCQPDTKSNTPGKTEELSCLAYNVTAIRHQNGIYDLKANIRSSLSCCQTLLQWMETLVTIWRQVRPTGWFSFGYFVLPLAPRPSRLR